jgi:hypothetical protein
MKWLKEYKCKLCKVLHDKDVMATNIHLSDPENLSVCDEHWKISNLKKVQKELKLSSYL